MSWNQCVWMLENGSNSIFDARKLTYTLICQKLCSISNEIEWKQISSSSTKGKGQVKLSINSRVCVILIRPISRIERARAPKGSNKQPQRNALIWDPKMKFGTEESHNQTIMFGTPSLKSIEHALLFTFHTHLNGYGVFCCNRKKCLSAFFSSLSLGFMK